MQNTSTYISQCFVPVSRTQTPLEPELSSCLTSKSPGRPRTERLFLLHVICLKIFHVYRKPRGFGVTVIFQFSKYIMNNSSGRIYNYLKMILEQFCVIYNMNLDIKTFSARFICKLLKTRFYLEKDVISSFK